MKPNRRAFATFVAIVMIGFVGVVLAITAAQIHTESHRTAATRRDAQFRQLLLAGTTIALDRAPRPGEQDVQVPLPPALQSEGATLRVTLTAGAPTRTATLHATFGPRRSTEILQLNLENGAWTVKPGEPKRDE